MKSNSRSVQNASVLVVNDDLTQASILRGLLEKEGIDVLTFASAAEALTAMNRISPPDLIITDLYMPGIDGWRFCRLLKSPEYRKLNPIPILVISATFSGGDFAEISADLGANAFVPSPVDGRRFLEQVHALLSGKQPAVSLRVLIVDDSSTLSSLLSKTFRTHGYVTETAGTCQEAMRTFENTVFDVVILDYHLPDGKGDGLLQDFHSRKPDCVFIMMTTDPNPDLALAWMKQGAAAFLHKPFKPEYLIELCANARRERSLLQVETLLEVRTRELRRSEERFRSIVSNAFDLVALIDTTGRYIYCNEAYSKILGYTADELLGKSCFDLVDPLERDQIRQMFQDSLAANAKFGKTTSRLLHRDGRVLHADIQIRLIFDNRNEPIILVNARNVTRQIQAENLLKQKSEERRLLLDTIPTQIWYLTDPETYGAVNQAHAAFLKRSPKDIAYKKIEYFLSADEAAACIDSNRRVFETGSPLIREQWLTCPSGERHLIHMTQTPKLDARGKVEFVVCAGNDITELRSLERKFRSIFEKAPVAIEIYDSNGRLQTANPRCIELFGVMDEKEIAEFNLFDDPNMTEENKHKLHRGETVYYESPFDFDKIRSAGLYRTRRSGILHLAVLITRLEASDRLDLSGYMAIIQDITQKKQFEAERLSYERTLQQHQKAESLGRMAGAIAHNFNNLLQVVIGNLEMAGMDPEKASERMDRALEAARKAAGISGMMLAYRGQIPGMQEPLNLSEICAQFLPMLKDETPNNVDIQGTFEDPGPIVRACAGQIHQVLSNLIANACEAAGDHEMRVELTVKTVPSRMIPAARRFPVDWQPAERHYACLELEDSGSGIPEKDLEKIFDPFFSTRFYGRGMGLSVVLGIVSAHNGMISVFSKPGRGTAFQIFLPVAAETIPPQEIQTETAAVTETSGTVLLVEDDKETRTLAAFMLKRLGFRVMEAESGPEALDIFDRQRNEICCVLSDRTLPGMDGFEFLFALRRRSPDIPVILSSGYDESHVMTGQDAERPDALLSKPYRFLELRNAIYQTLLKRK